MVASTKLQEDEAKYGEEGEEGRGGRGKGVEGCDEGCEAAWEKSEPRGGSRCHVGQVGAEAEEERVVFASNEIRTSGEVAREETERRRLRDR